MSKYTIVLLFFGIMLGACKKDKNTTEPTLDKRLVATWNFEGSKNIPVFGQIMINSAFLFRTNSTYQWDSRQYNNSGTYNETFSNAGEVSTRAPADTLSAYLSKEFNKTIIIDLTINSFQEAYIQFIDQNNSFWYYWIESDGIIYGNLYKKTQ